MVTMALPYISIRNWRRLHPTVDRVRRGEDAAEFVAGDNSDHRSRHALQSEAHAGLECGRAFGHRLYEVRRREVAHR
jgi:hypothetical protein